jgi:hypothetical protein
MLLQAGEVRDLDSMSRRMVVGFWVISDFRLPIADFVSTSALKHRQVFQIGNWQSEIGNV